MEITRAKVSKGPSVSLLRQLFPNNLVLILGLLGAAGILFVGGVYYGSQLARTQQAATVMDIARGVVGENVKIIPNYLSGLSADPSVLYIDMKNNDYQKLAYLRSEALAPGNTVISRVIKDETVKGELSLRGSNNKSKANLSFAGVNFDHIGSAQKWSLRADIKGDDLIYGMKKFSLLVPQTRARPPLSEWLNHRLEKHIGLISLNYEFINVILNGKNLGVYAMEEHFDKRLLERNGRREGIILKLDEQNLDFFKGKSIAKDPKLNEQARTLETLWDGFWAGDIPASALFDIDTLAKYYALTDLVNGRHTHYLSNEFFYLNPITRLLEPIAREYSSPYLPKNNFRLFVEDLNPNPGKAIPAANPYAFHSAIFQDADFISRYFGYLQEFSSTEFLDNFVSEHKDEIDAARKTLHAEFPYFDLSPQYLYDQIDYINNYINGDFSTHVTIYQTEDGPDKLPGQVTVHNKHHFPLRCQTLQVGENLISLKQNIAANGDTQVVLPPELASTNSHSSSFKCTIPGIDKPFDVKIFPWKKSEALAKTQYPVSDYAAHPNVIIEGSSLTIPAGLTTLTRNLVVSESQSLTVAAGATINLTEGAFILSYGPVQFLGSEAEPIKVFSSDSTGRGVAVLNAEQQSSVSHTLFSNLRAAEFPGWSISAAVLFNESPVVVDKVTFHSNQSEDALNIVRSEFEIKDSVFDGNKSDAFDSDFSRGTITNTRFLATGNDAIDTSGSTVEIRDIVVSGAGDKGVSVGEASKMSGTNLVVKESGIAISSKDNSSFDIDTISLDDNALAFALFQKKPEYGPTHGIARNMTITGDGEKFILEVGSSLQIDDTVMEGDIADAKVLMYGNVYGKKTIR
ncbi:MAG: CotH kinase family protein [Gammaproteobacteria bacterium]